MKTIARVRLDEGTLGGPSAVDAEAVWRRVAAQAETWCAAGSVAWRDAVVLVPFLELLAPARRAFGAVGGWMPRVETTRTLARSLGPPSEPTSERGFDSALDTLLAMQLLGRQKWGAEWSRRDPRGFERGAARVARTAHQLAQAAHALPPATRAAWWQRAREALGDRSGPGVRERMLAQVAVEWGVLAPAPDTDRLFDLQPSAWIIIDAGGSDGLAHALAGHGSSPVLSIDTDVALDAPFDAMARSATAPPAFVLCEGFEDEASASAAQVLDHLRRGEGPVALVAQDRVVVRRVRALLERAGVSLADETGWKLATTRAGAAVMALLAAARPLASADDVLAWLKTAPIGATEHPRALAWIESESRRQGAARRSAMAGLALDGAAADLRALALDVLRDFAASDRRTLVGWLDALTRALEACGSLTSLHDDAAGRQTLAALGLDPPLHAERRRSVDANLDALNLGEFIGWVDEVLEAATFHPPRAGSTDDGSSEDASPPDVVVTPLARATLRPFAAVVFPAADEQHLGLLAADDESLLPRRIADEIGLPSPRTRREHELLAFAQVLRCARVTLLRRRGDSAEPVVDSPFVERLRLALAAHGRALRDWHDPRVERVLVRSPVLRSGAQVPPALLPQRLSASAFEALRACPYRFFSRSVLRLGEAEELDDEVEKRDYGNWLHKVLHAFHVERAARSITGALPDAAADTQHLREIAEAKLIEDDIDPAAFLPFSSSFAVFAPRYIAWLHDRELAGWTWEQGETEIVFAPSGLDGVELYGRIDRIDRQRGASVSEPAVLELIDYKTGSASRLKESMYEAYEDTQLAFYAALVGAQGDAALQASYLALDGTRGIESVAHRDVEASAAALVAGAAAELRRIRAGEALPPLGEGSTCDFCEARGLCRRDHWTSEPPADDAVRAGR